MRVLYKYRPLSDFLFKELYYQELYFASYLELNDPLDLSARIEFTPKEIEQIDSLLWLIFKTTLKIHNGQVNSVEKENDKNLITFWQNENFKNDYRSVLFNKLIKLAKEQKTIFIDDLANVLLSTVDVIPFQPNVSSLKNEIARLSRKFLESSYTTCFSETNDDFLMWSHYASKHSGICLEFTLEKKGLFPFKINQSRSPDRQKYLDHISTWNVYETIFWDGLKKVTYQDKQPYINYFDFSPVFDNENDADLIGLSKSWTHQFAYQLENIFSTKTLPWAYEKEWRALTINFGNREEPEERIYHYPIECLTAIYFGIRTPEGIKKRIYKMFARHLGSDINYFTCVPTLGRELAFEIWQYCDE